MENSFCQAPKCQHWNLFNYILNKGDFPITWSVSTKVGAIHHPDNYRGIVICIYLFIYKTYLYRVNLFRWLKE